MHSSDLTVWAGDEINSLAFRLDKSNGGRNDEEVLKRPAYLSGRAVLVLTDFESFSFYYSPSPDEPARVFLHQSATDCANELQLVRSLWCSSFPQNIAIFTRTVGISIPDSQHSVLFSPGAHHRSLAQYLRSATVGSSDLEIEAASRLDAAFSAESLLARAISPSRSLYSMHELSEKLSAHNGAYSTTLREATYGSYRSRSYSIPLPRSLALSDAAVAEQPMRGDQVLSNREENKRGESSRDYCVAFGDVKEDNAEAYRIVLSLSHLMGVRRSGLFRTSFAKRIYTITLPPILLMSTALAVPEGFLVVPLLILYRVPNSGTFRRTFSLTLAVVPVRRDALALRDINFEDVSPRATGGVEWVGIRNAMRGPFPMSGPDSGVRYSVSGPLATQFHLSNESLTLAETLHQVLLRFLSRVHMNGAGKLFGSQHEFKPDLRSLEADRERLFSSTIESRSTTVLHLVDWRSKFARSQPWDDWVQGQEDHPVRDNVFKRMSYDEFIDPVSGYTGHQTLDIRSMLVGNRFRSDMNGLTFFDPTADLKTIIYPARRERFPNYSIYRWMAFSIFQDSALASMRSMLHQYSVDADLRRDILWDFRQLREVVDGFGELFELDIRYAIYRSEYEGVRTLANIDKDYQALRERLKTKRDDAVLEEQRLFNKLVVSLALAAAGLTMVTFLADKLEWTLGAYLVLGALLTSSLIMLSMRLFDPIRRLLKSPSD